MRRRDMGWMLGNVMIMSVLLAAAPAFAENGAAKERSALAQAMRGAWLPLESGLAVAAREGSPLSAKYEIDDGAFQLSVYAMKTDTSVAESFVEVIVDFNAATLAKVDAIADG